MRDYSNGRSGFDRVLMAVAATFLTVSASAAFAQAEPARSSAAELAIDAAVPRPEPANVPPPTASDFKIETTASTPAATATVTDSKPADTAVIAPVAPAPSITATPTTPAQDAVKPATIASSD